MATVSVIIPSYNYAHYLPECVKSVVSQTGVEIRILIIDDASTDNTFEVATALVASNPQLEYRRHTKNCGHIATYNEGLNWASGDYVVLLSADDMLTPGALQRATQIMDNQPEIGFVYGGCVWFDTENSLPKPRLSSSGSCLWKTYKGLDWLEFVCKAGDDQITSPEVVVRTSLQHKLGGYHTELPHTGDKEMWMRLAVHADIGQILDADQAFYRIHRQNMHIRQFSAILDESMQRRAAYDFIFDRYRDMIPGWKRLKKMTDRRLAGNVLWAVCQAFYHREGSRTPVSELIQFANNTYPGKFFGLKYSRVFFDLSYRTLQSINRKLKVALNEYGTRSA